MQFDFSAIRKSVQGLAGQASALRAQIETLKREREDILHAPVARKDMQLMIERWIDRRKDDYLAQLRVTLESAFANPDQAQDHGRANHKMTLVGVPSYQEGLTEGGRAVEGALCTFFGDNIKHGLEKAFKAMDWPEGGLPFKERCEAIKKLDVKIGDLSKQEADLVTTARSAGIVIGAYGHEE